MLIINADDWGKNELTTDNISSCYENGCITSVSAMVFMADSERSAKLAQKNHIDVGLHLNFTEKFDAPYTSSKLIEINDKIAAFLSTSKYTQLIYNPLLKRHFKYSYLSQYHEFVRLYNRIPSHINGHRHMHLCTNMIVDSIIPNGYKVRRNFSFANGEKEFLNRCYRNIVDKWLQKKYICTDYFVDIVPFHNKRLQKIFAYAQYMNVELMVHPERTEEFNFLMSKEYQEMVFNVKKSNYSKLSVQ